MPCPTPYEALTHCEQVSNEAAIKLYCNVFKYSFKQRRSGYYVDGEDGWSMELAGLLQAHQHSTK